MTNIIGNHWGEIVGMALFWSAMGHAVNTFPVPQNPYGRWLLGTIQFVVGQRIQATATKEGTTIQQKVADAVMLTGDMMPNGTSIISRKSADEAASNSN